MGHLIVEKKLTQYTSFNLVPIGAQAKSKQIQFGVATGPSHIMWKNKEIMKTH